ncbi:hypothetical protein AFULGI_00006100 [Archaeoglobus fulgidus DSM 8774]|uniref:Uncharacterized protein n=1 Tax=Archaeoglobus fulgidus DSM 8774 TaxID=1344584 RepID=A0A075WBS4_ARCFL|nr:hypothetical protein [Archaeoglobus fulgidus]AIG97411.1 hypothetical protein AFULGI_00006100 [Archaeoglobus fulgidus DSM 8774]
MSKKAYITILGRSTWALVNTYYAVLAEKAYYPDLIYIFAEDIYSDQLDKVIRGIEVLSEEFDFKPEIRQEIVREADFIEAGFKITSLIKDLKQNGYKVAIDITPGRKALVAGALIPISKIGVDHVFYLAIKTLDNASKPYKMIPLSIQELRDFVEDAKAYIGDAGE